MLEQHRLKSPNIIIPVDALPCTSNIFVSLKHFCQREVVHFYRMHFIYHSLLQVYLHHRLGPAEGHSLLGSLLATVDRVNSFSARFREFLADVTQSGLQKQYEVVLFVFADMKPKQLILLILLCTV